TDAARSGDAPRRRGAARADSPALKLRCGSCGSWGSGWGRGGGGGRLALLLLVLGAEAVGDDLLQAAFLVAGLVAGLGQLAVLPFVVVEEAVVLRLIGALAALDAALVSRGALRLRRLGLAAFAGLLGHEGSAPRKGAGFLPRARRIDNGMATANPWGASAAAGGRLLGGPTGGTVEGTGLVVVGLGGVGRL